MENLAPKDLPTVFIIPPFRVRQVVPMVGIVLFAGLTVYFLLMMVVRSARAFAEYPGMWTALFIVLLGGIIFFLRMALPPPSSLARLDIWHDRLRLTPDRMQRFLGDPPLEERIPAQSKEVVLCHSSTSGLNFGYSIIIRDASGAEHRIKSTCLNSLNQQQSLRLAEAISAATDLPVRLAVRLRTDEGSFQEVPWESAPPNRKTPLIVASLGGVIPILAGSFVGYHAVSLGRAAVIGLTVWVGWILTLIAVTSTPGKKFPFLYLMATIVTFSALYLVSVVFVEFLLRNP
jgi:hypothetical protein